MMHGIEGIGKTSFAACIPGAVFIPTEEGCNDLDVSRFAVVKSTADFYQCVRELLTEEHEFTWAVVDTIDWLERIIHEEAASAMGVSDIASVDYGKGWAKVTPIWRDVIASLDALRDKGISILLLAHSQPVTFKDPDGDDYDRYEPRLHKHASAALVEWCDEVFFAGFRTITKKTGESFGKKTNKAVGEGERVVFTNRSKPTAIAKNRLNMPAEIPLDFESYSRYL